jgi:Glu-tRNA(Gln) amidotransferase subunit E-like FAD-binding protein
MYNSKMTKEKTHWLQNPNKNYLGHPDLPGGKPLILTIKSAGFEMVENPSNVDKNTKKPVQESKRVIRFEEEGIKPFICNETNAKAIIKSTDQRYMEDSAGFKIMMTLAQTKIMGEMVDCIRIKNFSQEELKNLSNNKAINKDQLADLLNLLADAGKDNESFCESMRIKSVSELPERSFDKVVKRLSEIITGKNDENN